MISWHKLATFLVLAGQASTPTEGIEDEPQVGLAILAAERDQHERMTIPVFLNGAGPYRFMIDTGSQSTVVTQDIADRAALVPDGHATLVGMASMGLVAKVAVSELRFAETRITDLSVPLLEARHIGAEGILGLDSLQKQRIILDFRSDSIAIENKTPRGSRAGFEIVVRAKRKLGHLIVTDASIDGVKTLVIVDTGAQYSFGNHALKRQLRRSENADVVSMDVLGTSSTSEVRFAGKLEIGGLSLLSVPIGFADSPLFAALDLEQRPTLILGMQNLRQLDRVAIDFANRRISFDLAPDSLTMGLEVKRTSASRIPR